MIGSRKLERATEAAEKLSAAVPGAKVEGLENGEAAQRGPIVFLTVPFRAQSETLTNLKQSLAEGQLLVDCTVPLAAAISGKATRTVGVWQGSAAQQAKEMAPDGVIVVSALHTVSAPTLAGDGELGEDVLICGDRRADKKRAAEIIELIPGLRAVDAGPLEQARIVESLTAMLIGINGRYKTHAGIRSHRAPRQRPLGHMRSSGVSRRGAEQPDALRRARRGTGGAKLAAGLQDCWARGCR